MGIGVCWLHESAVCKRKTQETNIESEQHIFNLVFAWEFTHMIYQIKEWKIADIYTVTQSQMRLASTVKAPAWGKTTGSAAGGGWENCHMEGEHMFITILFLNNFVEVVIFLWNIY